MSKINTVLVYLLLFFCATSCAFKIMPKSITWKLTDVKSVGGYLPVVLGKPAVADNSELVSIYFNGENDGLILPVIPVKGWNKFTIEVLLFPDSDGPKEPRFLHFEDTSFNRATMELRLTPYKQWYLDAFLKNGKTGKGFALIDSGKLHASDEWYWVAMVFDGKKMRSYVNGVKELEQLFQFPIVTEGKISLGTRLNKVNWFKGRISEVRFHPAALSAKKLHRR